MERRRGLYGHPLFRPLQHLYHPNNATRGPGAEKDFTKYACLYIRWSILFLLCSSTSSGLVRVAFRVPVRRLVT